MELEPSDFQPGWRCESCEKMWDRDRDRKCSCGRNGVKVIYFENEWKLITRTAEAPPRSVVAVYPDYPWQGMLACSHLFDWQDKTMVFEPGDTVSCVKCWQEENVMNRNTLPDRNLLMVEVRV